MSKTVYEPGKPRYEVQTEHVSARSILDGVKEWQTVSRHVRLEAAKVDADDLAQDGLNVRVVDTEADE